MNDVRLNAGVVTEIPVTGRSNRRYLPVLMLGAGLPVLATSRDLSGPHFVRVSLIVCLISKFRFQEGPREGTWDPVR